MGRPSKGLFVDPRLPTSSACLSLKPHSLNVLLIFYGKRKMSSHTDGKGNTIWKITNNGEIVFPYTEALRHGISKKQFVATLDDLNSKGFIEFTHQGTGPGDSSTYKLCERWQAFGKNHFEPAPPRRKNTDPNFGFRGHHRKRKISTKNGT